jgi:hypothetical protein
MKVVDLTNLYNWQRVKTLVNALRMEKDYGCELSPYAKVLLANLTKLTTEALAYAKGNEYDSE